MLTSQFPNTNHSRMPVNRNKFQSSDCCCEYPSTLLKGTSLFQVRGKLMLIYFDFLHLDFDCTNLNLIDFPVQSFTCTQPAKPNTVLKVDSGCCSVYLFPSLPGMYSSHWGRWVMFPIGRRDFSIAIREYHLGSLTKSLFFNIVFLNTIQTPAWKKSYSPNALVSVSNTYSKTLLIPVSPTESVRKAGNGGSPQPK